MKEVVKTSGFSWGAAEWILGIGSALLIISAFLTWVKYQLVSGDIQTAMTFMSGIQTQAGYLTGAIGLAILIFLFLKKKFKIISIILGAVALLVSFLYWYYIKYVPKQILEVQGATGIGILLTMLASAGIIIGSVMQKRG